MSEPDDPKDPTKEDEAPPSEEELEGPSSEDLRDLLRRASRAPVPAPKADVLHGVQKRIRVRSRGKFYADGWSTREENPRSTYLVTALVMLVLVAVLYFALVPGGIAKPLPARRRLRAPGSGLQVGRESTRPPRCRPHVRSSSCSFPGAWSLEPQTRRSGKISTSTPGL